MRLNNSFFHDIAIKDAIRYFCNVPKYIILDMKCVINIKAENIEVISDFYRLENVQQNLSTSNH